MGNRRYKQGKDRLEYAMLAQRIEDFVIPDNPVQDGNDLNQVVG
jgi:hypothetical protein